MKIKITENGPYLVTGNIPIYEKIITRQGHHYVMKDGRELPQSESYALCRCGHSKNAPFCDGTHASLDWDGTETASKEPYLDRLTDVVQGETINLADDGRCAFARFCHREGGDVWSLTENDTHSNNKAEAIKAAHQCPAGRLTMFDKHGNPLEEPSSPAIYILQDPENHVSAGIAVVGPVTIEGADGTEYEVRNRVALCRCGHSRNKPFCDASHVPAKFKDIHD